MGTQELLRRKSGRSHEMTHTSDDKISQTAQDDGASEREVILDPQDNWIAQFFYSSRLGLAVNFALLISSTVHYFLTLSDNLRDEYFYEKIYKPLWVPTITQLFTVSLSLDIVMNGVIVLLLLPLSRRYRSSFNYWIIGIVLTTVNFAVIWFASCWINMAMTQRILVSVDFTRLSMKMVSFLVECSLNESVLRRSSRSSLLFFLLIPHLVYKPQYEKSPRIRWVKVLCHIWWLWVGLFPFITPLFSLTVSLGQFDFATEPLTAIFIKLSLLCVCQFFTYFIVVWFFFFENFCGLHGELLRFPHLKTFGTVHDMLDGSKVARAVNISVSQWISEYIYKPTIVSGGTRHLALVCTIVVSSLLHEICAFYILNIYILPCIIHRVFALIMYSLPYSNDRLRGLISISMVIGTTLDSFTYTAEYIAINFSTIPDVKNISTLRIVPVFLSFLLEKHLDIHLPR